MAKKSIPNEIGPLPSENDGGENGSSINDRLNRAVLAIETKNAEIAELRTTLFECKRTITEQSQVIDALSATPLQIGSVNDVNDIINPDAYEVGDNVVIVDEKSKFFNRQGRVASLCSPNGLISVDFYEVEKATGDVILVDSGKFLAITQENNKVKKFPQVRLLGKDDGSFVVASIGGHTYKLQGRPELEMVVGDSVYVNMMSKQVVEKAKHPLSGQIASVISEQDGNRVEIELSGGARQMVSKSDYISEKLDGGDRVVLCHSGTTILRKANRLDDTDYRLNGATNVTWSDIAGLEEAKKKLYNAITLPFKNPDIVKFYNRKAPKGILFYGPPGCGKTLCGKAVATELASLYGEKAVDSSFIYVKGPEILSKWVGESERKVRELFSRGEKHFCKNNYPAVLFLDEADALLSERGTMRSSDVDKTIVPMFLSLMDGLEEAHVLVILATNRPSHLDPAAIRDGRCDERIKIGRPTEETAPSYFEIHLRGVPLDGIRKDELATLASSFVFTGKPIYRVQGIEGDQFEFRLKDAMNGGMIAGIVKKATDLAIARDIKESLMRGVRLEDIQEAIDETYKQQLNINHSFDLEDFAESNNIDYSKMKVTRIKS